MAEPLDYAKPKPPKKIGRAQLVLWSIIIVLLLVLAIQLIRELMRPISILGPPIK